MSDYALMSDEELAGWQRYYARRRALVDEELIEDQPAMTASELAACHPYLRLLLVKRGAHLAAPVAVVRERARAYYDAQLATIAREETCRQRAAAQGVMASAGRRVPDAVLAAIKRAIRLDGAVENETSVRLGRLSHNQERRGACPFCEVASDPFVVHLADPDDEWYWCHACNQHGDVITLTAEIYGVTWREAVTILAQRCALTWPPAPPGPPAPDRFLARARGSNA